MLQGLHEQGILDRLRGALGARDSIAELAARTASTPKSVRALRNLVLLAQALGRIDPAVSTISHWSVPAAFARDTARDVEPPGHFNLFARSWERNSAGGSPR